MQDQPILWKMLMLAAHETSVEYVKTQPELARYVQDWGRFGDMGFIACLEEVSIGAVWLRLWSGSNRGFGYIDDTIPELAIAVLPEYRGQGIGTKLLRQI
jgi:GNAT superfamily N-acetyltransferase